MRRYSLLYKKIIYREDSETCPKRILFLHGSAAAHKRHIAMQPVEIQGLNYSHPPSNKKEVEAVEAGFQNKIKTFLKDLEALQILCNKCIQCKGEIFRLFNRFSYTLK